MKEKLMVGTHRWTTPEYAQGWDRIFGKNKKKRTILEPPENPAGFKSCHFCANFWECMSKNECWFQCHEYSLYKFNGGAYVGLEKT